VLIATARPTATLRLATQLLVADKGDTALSCLFSTIAACETWRLLSKVFRYASSTPRYGV